MRRLPRLSIVLLIFLLLAVSKNAHADNLVNRGSIVGNWMGTDNPDNMTNETTGTVSQNIIANYNTADYDGGGQNNIQNKGVVDGVIYGSYNKGNHTSGGGNTIYNYNKIMADIYGSHNQGDYSSGGENIIQNSGSVGRFIFGAVNSGQNSSGGGNTIYNYNKIMADIYGNSNGRNNTGGNNTIVNHGSVADDIYGSYNRGIGANGGSNTIINHGEVGDGTTTDCNIYGTRNHRNETTGGGNTITNYGGVQDNIYGTLNEGNNSIGGGNTITNNGVVGGDIYGTLNTGTGCSSGGAGNTIYNSGTVDGGIFAGDADDTVYILSGSNVAGVIDGQEGTDSLYFGASGTTDSSSIGAKHLNFENLGLYVDGDTSLTGDWILNLDSTVTGGGSLTLNSSLSGTSLNNQGTAAFNGPVSFSSQVDNSGVLSATDTFYAASLGNTGRSAFYGNTKINGDVVNRGALNTTSTFSAASLDNTGSSSFNGKTTIGGQVNNSGTLSAANSFTASSLSNKGKAYFSGKAVIGGPVSNQGYLEVNGSLGAKNLTNSGTAVINGRALITGTTRNSGTLNVNGLLSTVTLFNTGLINGTGVIHSDIINAGVISPGNSIGTLNVASSVTFEPGSTLISEIREDGSCDLLSVSGLVTINGGTLSTSLPRAIYTNGFSWELITAVDGVSGTFDYIEQPNSAVLNLGQKAEGTTFNLVLNRRSYGEFATGGAAQTGRGLDNLVPLASGQMENFLLTLDFDLNADQIGQVMQALNPEMYTAFSAASLNSGELFDKAMAWRMMDLDQRQASTENHASGGWNLWARALGLWVDQDQTDGFLGYGQATGGISLGADYALNHRLAAGLAAGTSRSRLSWSNGNYAGEINALHIGFYARAECKKAYARFSASYARLENSASRQIIFQGVGFTVEPDFEADLFATSLTMGYQLRFDKWLFEPKAGLNFQSLQEQGFTENGAGFLDMNIADRDTNSLASNLGFGLGRPFKTDSWKITPSLEFSWLHRLDHDRPSLDASFKGHGSQPFTVYGADLPQDLWLTEAGVEMSLQPNLDFFLHYNLAWADDYQAQALTAGLTISF